MAVAFCERCGRRVSYRVVRYCRDRGWPVLCYDCQEGQRTLERAARSRRVRAAVEQLSLF